MDITLILTDIDPRTDKEAAKNKIGDFLDECDPDDRIKIEISR